jgi:hypothetical protein
MNPKLTDFNFILRALNIVFTLLGTFTFFYLGKGRFTDISMVAVAWTACLTVEIILRLEKENRRPLIAILCFYFLTFFSLRFATLALFNDSVILQRGSLSISDIRNGFVFCLASLVSMSTGIFYFNRPPNASIPAQEPNLSQKPLAGFTAVLMGILLIGSLKFLGFSSPVFTRLSGYFFSIFNPVYFFIFGLIYAVIFHRSFKRKWRVLAWGVLALYPIYFLFLEIRSTPLIIFISMLFALLAKYQTIEFPKKFFVGLVLASPFVVFLVDLSFQIRIYHPPVHKIFSIYRLPQLDELEERFSPIAGRLAGIDMVSEIIAHAEDYRTIVNPAYLLRSFIDNTSPGIDPDLKLIKASNAMNAIYRGWPPLRREDIDQAYQSDLFTAFGEFYLLMYGGWAVLFLGLASAGFQYFYSRAQDRNDPLFRAFILFVFYYFFLNSYGIDWAAIDLFRFLIAFLICHRLLGYQIRLDPNARGQPTV